MGPVTRYQHIVAAISGQLRRNASNRFAQPPLDAIAPYSIPKLLSDRKTEPGAREMIDILAAARNFI